MDEHKMETGTETRAIVEMGTGLMAADPDNLENSKEAGRGDTRFSGLK